MIKSLIGKVLRFLIYGNFHIALGACVYLTGAFVLFQVKLDFPLLFFTFFATMSTYALHRHIGLRKISPSDHADRFSYFKQHEQIMKAVTLIAFSGTVVSLFFVDLALIVILSPCIVITGLYVLPVLGAGRRLRDLSFIKIFLIAFVWAYIFMLPKIGYGFSSVHPADWYIFLETLIFFIVLTLPFDMRDQHIDSGLGLQTLANSMSKSLLGPALIGGTALCMILSLISYYVGIYSAAMLAGMIIFYGLLLPGITKSSGRNEMYFLGFLDGYILLHGLIFLIINQLSI